MRQYHTVNLWREKTWPIEEKYDFHGENSRGMLTFATPRISRPQILREKLHEEPQNDKFVKVSRLPRLKFSIYMLFAHVPERQTLDFISLVPRLLKK